MSKAMSEQEAKEIIIETAKRIQHIDEEIKALREDRKEIIQDFKSKGLNVKALNEAIKRIRAMKKKPSLEQETEMYMELLRSIIDPV